MPFRRTLSENHVQQHIRIPVDVDDAAFILFQLKARADAKSPIPCRLTPRLQRCTCVCMQRQNCQNRNPSKYPPRPLRLQQLDVDDTGRPGDPRISGMQGSNPGDLVT